MKDYLIGISVFDEGEKIKRVIQKFNDYESYDVLIVDDGSTDHALDGFQPSGSCVILHNAKCRGAGFTTRQTIRYAEAGGYKHVILVSGNDKDDPRDVPKLISALREGYDFVQGSRFLPGGRYGRMPLYRLLATRFIHPWIFSFSTGKRFTDSTNGFRAIRLAILRDKRQEGLGQDCSKAGRSKEIIQWGDLLGSHKGGDDFLGRVGASEVLLGDMIETRKDQVNRVRECAVNVKDDAGEALGRCLHLINITNL